MSIWEYISLLAFALMTYPFIRFLETKDPYYARMILGLVCVMVFIKAMHSLPSSISSIIRRPKGACNCNIMNNGGSYEGRAGMPSGHVMTSAFIIYMIVHKTPTHEMKLAGGLCVLLIAVSRIQKKCHTPLQVIVGALLGAFAAHVTIHV
jgi:membrane-associated phospholipid phosphatase